MTEAIYIGRIKEVVETVETELGVSGVTKLRIRDRALNVTHDSGDEQLFLYRNFIAVTQQLWQVVGLEEPWQVTILVNEGEVLFENLDRDGDWHITRTLAVRFR